MSILSNLKRPLSKLSIPTFSRKKRVYSLTLDDDAIRYVRIKSLDPIVLDTAKEMLLPEHVIQEGRIAEEDMLRDVLTEVVKDWNLAKRDVAFLAPDTYVIIRRVAYPDTVEDEELKSHFFIEIGSTIYLPFDDPVFDVVPYTANNAQNEAILIASKESIMQTYEEVLKSVKLEPVVADIAPLSLYRLAHHVHHFEGTEHILLADLRGRSLTVSIFYSHYPLFIRSMELELPLSMSTGEELEQQVEPLTIVMELEKLANFYRFNLAENDSAITHLVWNGSYTQQGELLQMVRERLAIEALPLVKEPISCVDGTAITADFHRVIGLALKEEV
ncbi:MULTISPECIES: type IV pilus biogenesis protein PilM [unclassified Sporosarcina]|uniref:type IV pilus biogenesis protein PilM n=1 Tax=unclassified Sporosarcina TaxID=2647733 RepID=UPI000C1662ED|nr:MULTISPECIES: pilus assembly protein PilM [unclassified Sporosarcina]PIC98792.1 pilus assembly protein PilM [Sporosarcina sp. P29]PID07340.1 pilus assembly protein PilM [Sporosarcina sp. P30]PID10536.1 pilus assembly protein PilM [Sporosarcina sp. P31]PID13121.1 pilus assembly protein PilM [Sporosarcina sp. P32b]